MCKALFYYDIRILSVKQPITLLSEKPCYDAQYCAYQNCRNDGADAHTAGTVNSDQAGDNGNQVVAEGRKVTENHTDSNLQQVDRFKISMQKDNLDQNENGVKQNCCLAHFNAPDTGHGIGNGADRGYAQVGFD